jgi:glucose/arabinose dehydrogenase
LIALLHRSLLLLLFVVLTLPSVAQQQFRIDTLARAPEAQYPSGIAVSPQGGVRFFFTEKNSGRVRLFDGTLRREPFATVPVESDGEEGLLGIALHSAYPDTPYVFIYYVRAMDRMGIIERYIDSAGTGVHPLQIMVVPRMSDANEHIGGVLACGPDGKLYIGVGDHRTQRAWAQDTSNRVSVWGKILRINPDGSMPADNPDPHRPFWAWGLRDPQGLTFDRETGDLYCTEGGTEGPNAILLVRRGDNFGWPLTDRAHSPVTGHPLYQPPEGKQPALTGIVVYRGDAFPDLYGRILFCSNATPSVWSSILSEGGDSLIVTNSFPYPSGFADMKEGPDGCLYITNGPYISSKILRLSPIAPIFTSQPSAHAVQGGLWTYQPSCSGTSSVIHLVHGPEGMVYDEVSRMISWTPTNAQAVEGQATIILEARNGGGWAEQRATISIENTNDAPRLFALLTVPDLEVLSFSGSDAELTLHWERSVDPDLDTLQYIVEVDTTSAFHQRAFLFLAETADSIHIRLPHSSSVYYWRVIASDGKLSTVAQPSFGRITIASITPPVERPQRAVVVEAPAAATTVQGDPNPFPPSAGIAYTVRHAGHVRLSVYNLLGQEIVKVFEGNQQEGVYDVPFSRLNLPSGVYFYRLQAPGVFETKKMVIAR